MTKQECVVVTAYTGVAMIKGDDDWNLFYEYVEKLMGEPVMTHEIVLLKDEIKKRAYPDFLRLCETSK